jgi:hypothetical protein
VFATARRRTADLFGIHVPDVLFARNVNRLATEVRAKVEELESAVNGVRVTLGRHAAALELDRDDQPRPRTARHAAELLAKLSVEREAARLVAALARFDDSVTDQVLGAAIVSAPTVLAALDAVDWSLLDSARGFVHHAVLGERATRLVGDVARSAADEEFNRPLASVLGEVRHRAVELITEAARLASVAQPPSPSAPAPFLTAADRISLTNTGTPPLFGQFSSGPAGAPPASPRRGSVHRVGQASAAESVLADTLAEVRDYLRAHPGEEILISWQPISGHGVETP